MSSYKFLTTKLIRWSNWGPIKVPVFVTLLTYIVLSNQEITTSSLTDALLYFCFAMLHTALSYVTNAWGDLEFDNLSGRSNPFRSLSYIHGLSLILGLFFIAALSGLPFIFQSHFVDFWFCWAFLNFTYSLHPFRFKERRLTGFAFTIALQWTVPVFLTFAAMGRLNQLDCVIFAVANTVNGATLELSHMRYDRRRDLRLKAEQFRMPVHSDRLDQLYNIALFMDKTAIGMITVIIFGGITLRFGIWLGLLPLLIFLILLVFAFLEAARALSGDEYIDPNYANYRSANTYLHKTIPYLFIPGYLLTLIILIHPANMIFLILFIFWRFSMLHSVSDQVQVYTHPH
ncbi:hypothetical protein JW960_26405 [candidate division KSB1 bacterium]|nr:hypothetical protein [candidate division KSB1 bacterium]